jgi:hypothetical protein
MPESSYTDDILARHNLKSAVIITHKEYDGWVQIVLEDGRRIDLKPRIRWALAGAEPYIEVSAPDPRTFLR